MAYIDESRDDGLRRVRPLYKDGSSEWLVLSALVVKADKDRELVPWVREIRGRLKQVQRPDIHFRDLRPENKRLVCGDIAKLPVRCFAVMSNKKNMQGYQNPRAATVPARNWFYCWMIRLLLERVTHYCAHRTKRDWGESRCVRFVFSTRGGMSYPQFRAYLFWLRKHSRAGTQYLTRGDLNWSVVDIDGVQVFDHSQRAGLQPPTLSQVPSIKQSNIGPHSDASLNTQSCYVRGWRETVVVRFWSMGLNQCPICRRQN